MHREFICRAAPLPILFVPNSSPCSRSENQYKNSSSGSRTVIPTFFWLSGSESVGHFSVLMYTYTRSRTWNETSLSSFFYLSLYPGAKLTLSGAIAYIEPAGRAFWNSKSLCLYNCLNSKKRETLISPFLVEGLGLGDPLLVIKKDESAFSIQSPTLFRTVK